MPENIVNKYSANFANSNVLFKQGTQSALNNLITNGGASEGAFYLTNDTHRMYVGRTRTSDNKIVPVPVNEGITTVADVDALNAVTDANVGDFYFVTDGNILAVCYKVDNTGTGGARKCYFSQLNVNTDTNNRINGAYYNLSVPTGQTNQAKVEYEVTDDGGADVADSFTVIGGSNVTVTVDATNKTITLAAADTTYTLGVATTAANGTSTTLTLDGSTGTDTAVTLTGKDNGVKGKTKVRGTAAAGNTPASIEIEGPSIDGLGSYKKGTGNPTSTAAGSNSGFEFTLTVDGTENSSAGIDPIINVGAGSGFSQKAANAVSFESTGIHFVDGEADLNVYTKDQADQAISDAIRANLQTFDALQYKGAVYPTSDTAAGHNHLPAITDSSNGDVYKAAANLTAADLGGAGTNIVAKAGDLIIATGTEGANGKITSVSGTWEVIPSGDDETTKANSETHGFSLSNGVGAAETTEILDFKLNQGAKIVLTDSGTFPEKTISIAHEALDSTTGITTGTTGTAVTQTDKQSAIFTAITGLTVDNYGHTSSIEKTTLTVVDTHANIDTVNSAASSITGGTKIALTVADSDNIDDSTEISYVSDTINISGATTGTGDTNATVTMNIVWGSF